VIPCTLAEFEIAPGRTGKYHRIAALEAAGLGRISRMPHTLRVVLESLVRNLDGTRVTEAHVRDLAAWRPAAPRTTEVPFIAVRIVLQDMIGFPCLNDLAAMRAAAARLGVDPRRIEPSVPVDVVIDHSVEVDVHNAPDALKRNMTLEFSRNAERYQFVKWARQAYSKVRVIPPGNGIIHQINLEYLARGVCEESGVWFPDTVVGTDSHTPMVNGIGIVGWGVGGIEAEAGMLGQPVFFLTPDVVGAHLKGKLQAGVTATDLALTVTELLRRVGVVGKFVEFFGDGARSLSAPDRAVIANMAPEYGATTGYFAVDEQTLAYYRTTGRDPQLVSAIEAYSRAQGLLGIPSPGEIDYTQVVELDLARVAPSVAGPKRPQDRVDLRALKARFDRLFSAAVSEGGYAKDEAERHKRVPLTDHPGAARHPSSSEEGKGLSVGHGDILIAAITSCTNTSNPSLLLAAGLLAKRAVERGLRVPPHVKPSLAPGSKVVTAYLREAGLLPYLERLGFGVVAYGCTTCMGAAGPLDPALEEAVVTHDLIACAVLSGNRNFEARVHPHLRANFLMSPPLVVAFALAGRVDIDLTAEPIGRDGDGRAVYLEDLWPSETKVETVLRSANRPDLFQREYADLGGMRELWDAIPERAGAIYPWDPRSSFIREPPFFARFAHTPEPLRDILGARALALFGDSITTDHISPVSRIRPDSPAGAWLAGHGVTPGDLGHYGVRRCNHEVMVRGTFANARLRNRMVAGTEGGVTVHHPSGEQLTIYDAAQRYRESGVPLLVFAGEDYGMGSSRDWAAKGPQLLGVRAVIARSFERIHRTNLICMGVLPCAFQEDDGIAALGLDGSETYDLFGLEGPLRPRQELTLVIRSKVGSAREAKLTLRADIGIEIEYLRHGGILPYVLRKMIAEASKTAPST